jgi:hypothetical protein
MASRVQGMTAKVRPIAAGVYSRLTDFLFGLLHSAAAIPLSAGAASMNPPDWRRHSAA